MSRTLCTILPAALLLGIILYFALRGNKRRLKGIKAGKDVLVNWSYSPEDWKIYMTDDSSVWVKNKDVPGDVFITPDSIYVTNGADEKYFQFGWRQISDCSFSNDFLELRKDWTQNSKYGDVNQYHEEIRLFVPLANREKVAELVEEFKVMAAANPPARQRFGLDN